MDLTKSEPETVPCGICGKQTKSTGSKRCDRCWELEHRIQADPEIARKILASIPIPETKYRPRQIVAAILALRPEWRAFDEEFNGLFVIEGIPGESDDLRINCGNCNPTICADITFGDDDPVLSLDTELPDDADPVKVAAVLVAKIEEWIATATV